MLTEKISFENQNHETLSGYIDWPSSKQYNSFALFAHCFTCNKDLSAIKHISNALTQNNIAVLRFDFTGLGTSEGDFSDSNFASNIQDLVYAAKFLENNYVSPQLIIGHSLGGAASIFAANKIHSIQTVATIGAPHSPEHVSHLFNNNIEQIKSEGSAKVNIGGRPFVIKSQFIDDINSHTMNSELESLNASLLILHSPDDSIVEISNARSLYENAVHPKSFISLQDADHLLSKSKDSIYVGEVISSWAKRYITANDNIKNKESNFLEVSLKSADKFTCHINSTSKAHMLIADEPKSLGGLDKGPNPYDFLLSSLGSCTAITLRMYANIKKIQLDDIIIKLKHERITVANENNEQLKQEQIIRHLELIGNISQEQLIKLTEIADKCPVHKTLSGGVKIITYVTK